MASPNPFGNPKAPPFVPTDLVEVRDIARNLFGTASSSFTAGSTSTPMTRSATPKRPRTTNSPPPTPPPPFNWEREWKEAGTQGGLWFNKLSNFTTFQLKTVMSKFESQHAETIVALTDSIKFLLE